MPRTAVHVLLAVLLLAGYPHTAQGLGLPGTKLLIKVVPSGTKLVFRAKSLLVDPGGGG